MLPDRVQMWDKSCRVNHLHRASPSTHPLNLNLSAPQPIIISFSPFNPLQIFLKYSLYILLPLMFAIPQNDSNGRRRPKSLNHRSIPSTVTSIIMPLDEKRGEIAKRTKSPVFSENFVMFVLAWSCKLQLQKRQFEE